ncbi:unnamed protein product [Durusdinium trenchii]|uniref:Fibronectin type-III domain-containing protein n=1 Tax=Durusdinium trenchii TaxID=1381693 RepID=A0ABP0N478_9DINO
MVLASAGRVFRALSTNLMVQMPGRFGEFVRGTPKMLKAARPACPLSCAGSLQDSSNEALVEAESHGALVSAFLQEVTTFLQQTDFAATPGATDRYPHLSLLLRGPEMARGFKTIRFKRAEVLAMPAENLAQTVVTSCWGPTIDQFFQVRAWSAAGMGQWSASSEAMQVDPVRPAQPQPPERFDLLPRSVVVHWKASESGLAGEGGYAESRDMSRSCEVTGIKATGERGDASSFPVTSLRPAQTYYFQVRCINLMGTSDWSDPSMPVKIKQDPVRSGSDREVCLVLKGRQGVPGLRQISDSRQTFYSDILGGNSGAYGREEFQPSTIQPPFWLEPMGAQLLRDVVQEDETLHATVRRPRIVSNRRAHAFACICMDGSVLAWGAQAAGDCSHVRDQLKEVTSLSAIAGAFAALLENGEVVTWGDHIFGGDTSSLRSTLKEVREVQATAMAFAALRADGTVITWGSSHVGGNCSRVQGHLRQVQKLFASAGAFAALRADQTVVTWAKQTSGATAAKCNTY